MDRRDRAANTHSWFTSVDPGHCTAIFDDGECEHVVPIVWRVCPTCDGRGTHVNPSIDAHGITGDEWDQWSIDERSDYFSGVYDVSCYECGGRTTVPVPSPQAESDILLAIERFEAEEADYAAVCESERRFGC